MEKIDENVVNLLENIDKINLGELSVPSTYDFIRYSRAPLIDTQADYPCLEDVESYSKAFALNFSNPPKDLRQNIEDLIDNNGEMGTDLNEWYRSSAKALANTALEAGRIGKRTHGATGYVLMSDINEELNLNEYREHSDIPDYFFEESELNSSFYVFEGDLNGKRDIKISTITEDETAVAWYVGRTLENFDMDDVFKESYNQRVENFVESNYPERI